MVYKESKSSIVEKNQKKRCLYGHERHESRNLLYC